MSNSKFCLMSLFREAYKKLRRRKIKVHKRQKLLRCYCFWCFYSRICRKVRYSMAKGFKIYEKLHAQNTSTKGPSQKCPKKWKMLHIWLHLYKDNKKIILFLQGALMLFAWMAICGCTWNCLKYKLYYNMKRPLITIYIYINFILCLGGIWGEKKIDGS